MGGDNARRTFCREFVRMLDRDLVMFDGRRPPLVVARVIALLVMLLRNTTIVANSTTTLSKDTHKANREAATNSSSKHGHT